MISFFSATWPKEVEELANDFLRGWVQINVGYENLAANPDVRQHIWFVEPHDKKKEIMNMLFQIQGYVSKVLIFCQTKTGCDDLQAHSNTFVFDRGSGCYIMAVSIKFNQI
jgi:ATP-dependent RNA helicase DDX5/DBP2